MTKAEKFMVWVNAHRVWYDPESNDLFVSRNSNESTLFCHLGFILVGMFDEETK